MEAKRARALMSYAAGLRTLERACAVLHASDIEVMPLKGVWLQSCVYARPDARSITDVDALVPGHKFAAALRALERAGFAARQGNIAERTLYAADLELPIDLHRRLFMPGAFALPTHALFARGALGTIGSARVVLPDPIDALCHLVGHLVKSRGAPFDEKHMRDFEAIEARFSPAPEAIAERLTKAGMSRAARYALHGVARHGGFFRAVLAALPRDRVGEALAAAWVSRSAGATVGTGSAGALGGFLLERSLPAALRALAMRVACLPADRPPQR